MNDYSFSIEGLTDKDIANKFMDEIISIEAKSKNQDDFTNFFTVIRDEFISRNKSDLFEKLIKQGEKNEFFAYQPIAKFTQYEFLNSEAPYKFIFGQKNEFSRQQAIKKLDVWAKEVGVKGFPNLYKQYVRQLRAINKASDSNDNKARFHQMYYYGDTELELHAGEYLCDDTGVSIVMHDRIETVCKHPIIPVEKLINIDTKLEKMKIAYYKGGRWKSFIASKSELFNAQKLVNYSDIGINVTSSNAKLLANFLSDMEVQNEGVIPENFSVSRMGFVDSEEFKGFVPYVEGLNFDGSDSFRGLYNSISQKGSFEKWREEINTCCKYSLAFRILIASAFSSVLVSKIGCLPYFTHVWSTESGSGKTVALYCAASVWGNPVDYTMNFNSTQVGMEKTAAFLNHLPMCIDELQLVKDERGNIKFDVYGLAEGKGKTRGNKHGGIDSAPTWSLVIITSGETPLTNSSSGAGAVNRVINVETEYTDKIVLDGSTTAGVIKANYGHAGKMFVEALTDEIIEEAKQRYKELFRELSNSDTTEKQASAAAMTIIGYELANKLILKNDCQITLSDISRYLQTKKSVSAGERAYSYIKDWISQNSNSFIYTDSSGEKVVPTGSIYGEIRSTEESGDVVNINSSLFRKVVKDGGFNDKSVLSWLRTECLIQTRNKGFTINKKIKGIQTDCVVLKITSDDSPNKIEMLN